VATSWHGALVDGGEIETRRRPDDSWQDRSMTASAAQAEAFYAEVLRDGLVWAVSNHRGFPTAKNGDGQSAVPFWSLRSRAERIIASVDAYAGYTTESIPLDAWRERWLPDLSKEGLYIGLNWSGAHATGYDLSADDVAQGLLLRSQT
jgi:hypothetical protein